MPDELANKGLFIDTVPSFLGAAIFAKSVVNFWQMVSAFCLKLPVFAKTMDVKKPPSPYEKGVWRFLPAIAGLCLGALAGIEFRIQPLGTMRIS